MATRAEDTGSGLGTGVLDIWQKFVLALLSVVALACLHCLFFHLHAILIPFVLSSFIVLALQPVVEVIYRSLAGLSAPYRWFICCLRRKQRPATQAQARQRPANSTDDESTTADEESVGEATPLLAAADQPAPEDVCTTLVDGVCRTIAVALVLLAMIFLMLAVGFALVRGAVHLKENWRWYTAGLARLVKSLDDAVDRFCRRARVSEEMEERIQETVSVALIKAQGGIWEAANGIVLGLSECLTTGAIMFLYIMFWLMQPLPTGGKAGILVRSYITKKTLVSFLYGLCVALLFLLLGIDLAMLFGMISFFLNFVPEVGAFISMLMPIPVIVLDGRIDRPFVVLAASLVGQLALKFIFGTILEVKLIERDKEMNIHPVWIILGLSYFGFVWGPTGMLISVPMLAMLKTAAMSAREMLSRDNSLFATLAEHLLACLEGRRPRDELCPSPKLPGKSVS